MSSGSSSEAQIFNCSKFREKIEDGTLGLPPPETLGEVGPGLHYFWQGDDAIVLMPRLVKPYSRRQLTREERRISRGRRMCLESYPADSGSYWAQWSKWQRLSETLFNIVLTLFFFPKFFPFMFSLLFKIFVSIF